MISSLKLRTVGAVLSLAMCAGAAAQNVDGTGKAPTMHIQEIHVQRVTIVTNEPFDTVVARIDARIGHPDIVDFHKKIAAARNEADMEQVINPITKPDGLMEFARFDHGGILRKESGQNAPRIIRIVAGNPLIMKEMVKHVADAGSYAPITILIEERVDSVKISYDRMASYLAPYGDADALKVAQKLDEKVEKILVDAAK